MPARARHVACGIRVTFVHARWQDRRRTFIWRGGCAKWSRGEELRSRLQALYERDSAIVIERLLDE
jgi:hypothetical protein